MNNNSIQEKENCPNKNNEMSKQNKSEEIDLYLIAKFFYRNWIIILTAVLIGVILFYGICAALPPKFRAAATVKIGSIPDKMGEIDNYKFTYIEQPAELTERLKQSDQIDKLIDIISKNQTKTSGNLDRNVSLVQSSLSGTYAKNSGLVQLTVSAHSPEIAESVLNATLDSITDLHQLEFSVFTKRNEEKMQQYNQEIEVLNGEIKKLQNFLEKIEKLKSTSQISSIIIAIQLLANKKAELRDLIRIRGKLQDQMMSTNFYPTTVIKQPRAETSPYFPKLILFLIVGGVIGFISGVLFAFLREMKPTCIKRS